MTILFDRFVQLSIDEGKGGKLIELSPELSVAFEVKKDRGETANTIDIDVANLGPTTKAALKKASTQILLKAGYGTTAALLAVGQVVHSVTSWSGADSITRLSIRDGIVPLRSTVLSLSFKPGATVGEVLEVIASKMGLPVLIGQSVKATAPFTAGYSYVGRVSRALTEVCHLGKCRWSIQNGVLNISGPSDKRPAVYELTPSTGLLARIEEVEATIESGRLLKNKRPNKGYSLTCLLLPSLSPNDWVKVESRDLKGEFIIDSVSHQGGNRQGGMTTRMTVYER